VPEIAGAATIPVAAPGGGRTRRRWPATRRTRWLAGTLAVLLALLVVADRVAAHLASDAAVRKIVAQSQGLPRRPPSPSVACRS